MHVMRKIIFHALLYYHYSSNKIQYYTMHKDVPNIDEHEIHMSKVTIITSI